MKHAVGLLLIIVLILALLLPAAALAADAGIAGQTCAMRFEPHDPAGALFTPSLTEQELELVEASKTNPINVGVITSSAPACFFDEESGEFAGIFMELLKTVSQKTGLNLNFVPLDLSLGSPIAQLRGGSPELVAGILKTSRFMNDATLALSNVLISDSLVIVGRKDDDFTSDAGNKTIAYTTGFQVAEEYLAEKFPAHTKTTYATADECLKAVSEGKVDAAIYTRTCVNYLLHNPRYENLEVVPAYYRDVSTCVAGLSADKSDIVGIINKGLSMISEDERNEIIMNVTIMNPYPVTVGDMLYKYRIPLIVISILLLVVIAVLIALNATKRRNERELQQAFKNERLAHEQEKAALIVAEQASAAKGNFMSRMSHEIRTPLNAIIGYNTLARNDMAKAKTDTERRQSEMRVMDCLIKSEIASKHLLSIINDVLDMSAIESGKIVISNERFDFKGMITSLSTIFYSQAKAKNVDLEVVFDALTEEWLIGDQVRVNQVLTNLLSNAVKFTPSGGKVTLLIYPEIKGDEVNVRFEVSDTGIGMSEEYLTRIWTPFEQADSSISRRFGGSGLGLSITKTLVDLMKGSIRVESKLGEGSKFNVELTFKRTEQPTDSGVYDFSGINALIVDDDVNTCDYIRLLLARCSARGAAVTSGEDAIRAVEDAIARRDPYTVCLVDWRMPTMDGIETIKRLRAIVGNELPIIVITAYDYSEVSKDAEGVGVKMFISKPLFQSSLFDLLVNISNSRPPKKTESVSSYDFNGSRVLLVEDNTMNMEIAKRILQSAKLTVDAAWNGEEAVKLFTASPSGTYSAILMDVQMPIMDGHTAARTIRASGHADSATVPIIAMTADAFAENVAQAIAAGMNDHIAKPIDLATLFGTLEKYINKEW